MTLTATHYMYKASRIGIIVLYPVLKLLVPLLAFGILGSQLSQGQSLGVGIDSILLTSTLLSLVLLIFAGFYLYYAFKRNLFKKGTDGKRPASVADYFAAVFSIMAISDVLSNILKLVTQ